MSTVEQLPGNVPIRSKQGDDFTRPVQFRHGSPAVAMDLTGYTIEAHISTKAGEIPLLIYSADLSTGLITFTLSKTQSADLIGAYQWEMTWTDPSGNARSVLEGIWEFVKNV